MQGLIGRGGTLHRFFANDEMAERCERCEKGEVDRLRPLRRRVHVFRKTLPFPGNTAVQHVKRDSFHVDEVPRRDLTHCGLARRNTDTAIAHYDSSDSVPGGATDERVPADLGVVMGMRIDKTRSDDQSGSVEYAARAVLALPDFGDASLRYRQVRVAAWRTGAVREPPFSEESISCSS